MLDSESGEFTECEVASSMLMDVSPSVSDSSEDSMPSSTRTGLLFDITSPEGLEENPSSCEASSIGSDSPELLLLRFCSCKSRWCVGDFPVEGSSMWSAEVEDPVAVSEVCGDFNGDCCVVIEDCLLVEFDAELVVESSTSSMTLHVCKVASGANETLRFARDFRRAALRSNMAFFSACRLCSSSWSRSVLPTLPSPLFGFEGVCRLIGLKGSATLSAPVIAIWLPSCLFGPGVEKSISRSSAAPLVGDLPFPVLRFRNSSKDGIAFGGVSGIVGFRIDLIGKGAVVYHRLTMHPACVIKGADLCCISRRFV